MQVLQVKTYRIHLLLLAKCKFGQKKTKQNKTKTECMLQIIRKKKRKCRGYCNSRDKLLPEVCFPNQKSGVYPQQ